EAHLAAQAPGERADLGDALAYRGQRLAPQRVHVAVLDADDRRRTGGAAEVQGNRRLLQGLDVGERALDPIELAGEVEGLLRRPDAAHDLQIFVGPAVAGVVVEPVAVARLLGVAAAGDDVQGQAAAG